MNQNSSNSSRPPSSDGLKRKPSITKEPKGHRGQKGHKGNTLRKVEHPDHIIRLTTPVCGCGLPLDADSGEVEQTYQVFDLPQPKLEVTEYQRIRQRCACGCDHLGALPAGVHASVQYGSGVRALTVLLNTKPSHSVTIRQNGTSDPSKQSKKWQGVFEPPKAQTVMLVYKASAALVVSINAIFSRNFVLSAAPLIYMSHPSGAK